MATVGEIFLASSFQSEIDAKDKRIADLETALREARGMLSSCGFESPEDDLELLASWERGLAKIDAALTKST